MTNTTDDLHSSSMLIRQELRLSVFIAKLGGRHLDRISNCRLDPVGPGRLACFALCL